MNLLKQTISHLNDFSREFWVQIIATFINQLGNMVLVFLMLYLSGDAGYSLVQASIAFMTFGAGTITGGLSGSFLIDRVGALRILILSLIINSAIILSIPFLNNFLLILIACFLWGNAFGLYRSTSQTLISYLSPAGLNKVAFSLFRLAINLGMSIGPVLGAYLAMHSFKLIFYVNGLANISAALILIIGLKDSKWFNFYPAKENQAESNFNWIKKDHTFCLLLLGIIPICMVFFQHESTLSIYLKNDLGFPLSFYGWLFTINTLLIVFFELLLNVATLNWPYRVNFLLGTFLITIGFLGMICVSQQWHVVFLTVIWTFGEMILFPATSSYVADIAPMNRRASYMSLYTVSTSLGMLLGPWGGAILMQHTGAASLWIACGVCGIITFIIFNFLSQPDINSQLIKTYNEN